MIYKTTRIIAMLLALLAAASASGQGDSAAVVQNPELENARALLQVQRDFVARFAEALTTVKVARFYQLENKMDAEVDAQLALVVPLVE